MPSSPTFPMSSCLTGATSGSRTYRLELDIVAKSSSPSRCSSPSSTLSESSNSTPLFTSTKRARAPRKRPNQCSAEATALLATIFPRLFPASNLHQPISLRWHPPDDPFPVLLPSFPIPDDSGFLLHQTSSSLETPPIGPEVKPAKVPNVSICTTPDLQFQNPASPDFDAESILDEEVEEGIDSIMGNLSKNPNHSKDEKGNLSSKSLINPYLSSLMGLGIGNGFGFGFGISSNIRRALRQTDDGEWWRTPAVAVKDIVGGFTAPPDSMAAAHKKKKKKKKVEKEAAVEAKVITHASPPGEGILKPRLGLKLNYDGFLNEWCGGSPFFHEASSPESAADAIASLADIDLFPDTDSGAVREASVQRYKEKRRTRLFSKKIRYQVRKVNADQRPRMKGRFVKMPSLLQEAMTEAQS